MRIRKASDDDIPRIMELERESETAAHWPENQYRGLFDTHERGVSRLVLIADCSSQDSSALDTTVAGGLAGFLIARHLAPDWELENIVVSPGARRKGIGRQLLDSLIQAGRETDSGQVFLEVRESNCPARSLYENFGFKQTGRRKSYYSNPSEDAILYRFGLR